MAEETQTAISTSSEFDIFQKPTPITSESESIVLPQVEEQKIKEVKQEDEFSIFQKPTIKVDSQQEDEFSIFQKPNQQIISTPPTKKYSNAALIRYGIDKQNTFFGNAYRVVKAGTQAAFDPEKDFKDYIKYNFEKEQLKLKQKYGDLASGAYDDETLVKAAEIATFMTDPFYILAYMTPWGRVATSSMKGLAAVSGTTVGLDVMLDQLATTGTIDAKTVGVSAAAATVLGPLSVKAIQGISKLLPGANKQQLEKVIGIVEGKKAKDLGISKKEFHNLQKIAGDKEILSLNKSIQEAGVNFVKPISEQTKIFNQAEKRLSSQIAKYKTKLESTKSKKELKAINKKLLAGKKKQVADREAFNSAQKAFWKTQSGAAQKVNDLIDNVLDSYTVTYFNTNRTKSVPLDPANTDYQAIQEWVAEGNTIAEAD